ncbi:MAG: HAMP domain-containing histidine kinase [Bacteroidetes bacterium]|nr:HAMP domain-containing histidine kinase [Bacteroidota bacterium]
MATDLTTTISLHRFVDELMAGLLPRAVSRKSIIINQIDRDIEVSSDENLLAFVLWNLLDRTVDCTQSECIHIESVRMDEGTMIRVRNAGVYFYRSCADCFRQVQDAAEKIGGTLSIDYSRDTNTTIALTLQNRAA